MTRLNGRKSNFLHQIFYTLLLAFVFTVSGFAQGEKTAAGLYNEGLALLKQKDYAGGLALMEDALAKAGPDDEKVVALAKKNGAVAAYNAANSLRKGGSHDDALAMYNKGIELNPANSSNYEGIARTYEAQGKTADAIKAYLDAADKGNEEGKADKAEKRAKKAQTMVGKLFVSKDYATAISAGEAFLSVKNDAPEVHYYVSRSYAESGNSEKALEHATQAVSLSPDTTPDKYFYAQATQYEKLGKKTEAIAAYKMITGEKYKAQAEYKISELGG